MLDQVSIQVENLSKRFNREWIFKNFTYQFHTQRTYAVTGPNGSGKSTLMQILWGQMPPTSGTLQYTAGQEIIDLQQIYRHLAIATPYLDLIEEFTLQEQLTFHFQFKKRRNHWTNAEMLSRMELIHAKDKVIGNFSSGMRQRLKLALAFYTDVDILFLDEPSTNLDSKAFAWFKAELENVTGKILIFIATNQLEELPAEHALINMVDLK